MGTVSMDKEDGTYKEGATASVKAEAKEGFEFVGWKKKDRPNMYRRMQNISSK
ncbi:MAG: hypothetical protein V8T65_01320 [Roseburia inulinivorans]